MVVKQMESLNAITVLLLIVHLVRDKMVDRREIEVLTALLDHVCQTLDRRRTGRLFSWMKVPLHENDQTEWLRSPLWWHLLRNDRVTQIFSLVPKRLGWCVVGNFSTTTFNPYVRMNEKRVPLLT